MGHAYRNDCEKQPRSENITTHVFLITMTKNNYCCVGYLLHHHSASVFKVCMPTDMELVGVYTMVIFNGNQKSYRVVFWREK